MHRFHSATAATACLAVAVLVMSSTGLWTALRVCLCSDGPAKVETTSACSCCHTPASETLSATTPSHPISCSDCIDIPLQIPPVTTTEHDFSKLSVPVFEANLRLVTRQPEPRRSPAEGILPTPVPRPEQGLLSSVVLLT